MQRKHASWLRALLSALAGVLAGSCTELPPSPAPLCDDGSACRDSDCDFICDLSEGIDRNRDSDRDGMPDYLDTDSDGDGIRDRDEAGDEDRLTPPVDRDENGLEDYLDPQYPLHFRPQKPDASQEAEPAPERDAAMSGPTHPASEMPGDPSLCQAEAKPQSQCTEDERGAAECDGLDNDCDGRVDNNVVCTCTLGAARSCFLGPYSSSNVGACRSGSQRCVGEEFSHWGPCENSVAPSPERCDGLDNDCDGCSDELSECKTSLTCPGPGDPRLPAAQPFVPYLLDARRFYAGPEALSYRFSIRGSACDRMFQRIDPSADAESGKQSYLLQHANTAQAEVLFTLSGSYTVELVVVTRAGELRCTFVVNVRAPGIRVELCWDKTGPIAQQNGDAVDLDLHLAKLGATTRFETPSDCFWQSCRGDTGPWGYANTSMLSACTGPAAQNFATYNQLGFCPNPRLDADNRLDARSRSAYITENINLDVASPGDRFRIAVVYKANVLSDVHVGDAGTPASIDTRVWVNVYCEGELLGTFGGDPEQQLALDAVQLSTPGMLWRVADVAVSNASCEISALRDPLAHGGHWITTDDFSYGEP